MYFAAGHIAVKKDQDRSLCITNEQYKVLALCDGIGEFKDSGKVAELLIEAIRSEVPENRSDLEEAIRSAQENIKLESIVGGTTLLCCYQAAQHTDDQLTLHHLGNGAIIHMAGDFHLQGPSQAPYRTHHLILPHVDEQGVLIRHLSHDSGPPELALSECTLRLNTPTGDILLLVTDGIATMEEEMAIVDVNKAVWRLQSKALQQLIERLHAFLEAHHDPTLFTSELPSFVTEVLHGLKADGLLEDDASLGIVVTDAVLTHYRMPRN